MNYSFISISAKTEELVNHLRTHFGIEKTGSKKELFDEIIKQENLAGYVRQNNQDKSGEKPNESEHSEVKNTDLPLMKQKRVKIVIAQSESESGDVYVSIGDWDALIKRDTEVEIPESAYLLLANAGETRYTQNEDGTLTKIFAPRYSIKHLGYA